VHIGDFVVTESGVEDGKKDISLAVLMPVYNTKIEHLRQAVDSVLN